MPQITCYQCGIEKEMSSLKARFCSGACKLKWNRIATKEKKATVSPTVSLSATVSRSTVSKSTVSPATVSPPKNGCEYCEYRGRPCLTHEPTDHANDCTCDRCRTPKPKKP